jgi:hypothetical protein
VSPQDSFSCPDKQEQVAEVKFLMTIGNTGWMPGLYVNSKFRPLLETWFPSDNPFYHAAHFLLHPNDQVWGKIKSAYDEVFWESDVRVGLQIRHLEGGFYAPIVKKVKILHADEGLFMNSIAYTVNCLGADQSEIVSRCLPSTNQQGPPAPIHGLKPTF